jgi:hypothetical protein
MTLTRRDLLTGAAGVAAGGVAAANAAIVEERLKAGFSQEDAYRDLPDPAPSLAPIPTDAELRQWETHYKARYKAAHTARNRAILDMANGEEAIPKRADLVLEDLHAEQDAALGLVDESREQNVAIARGEGFGARRSDKAATENPHWPALSRELNYGGTLSHDLFMAWYAGWVQAGDQSHVLDGSRGYTPPQPYFCSLCGVAEGKQHNGGCADQNPVHPDGLIVRRPRPWRHGGHTFT